MFYLILIWVNMICAIAVISFLMELGKIHTKRKVVNESSKPTEQLYGCRPESCQSCQRLLSGLLKKAPSL